jgi:CRP/FNR family transcriptional activator FtrB
MIKIGRLRRCRLALDQICRLASDTINRSALIFKGFAPSLRVPPLLTFVKYARRLRHYFVKMLRYNVDNARNLPLFRGISKRNFDLLMEGSLFRDVPKGAIVIREGQVPQYLYLVVDGLIELFASFDGEETTLDIARPPSTFILAAVVRDEVFLKSARALVSARILAIPAAAVREVFGRDAAFARAVVAELAFRYRVVVRALKNEKLRTSTERLANWIRDTERMQGGRGFIELEFEKKTLASLLGMTPANLSRELSFLSRHGIRTRGRQIVIKDRHALAGYARPTPLIDG